MDKDTAKKTARTIAYEAVAPSVAAGRIQQAQYTHQQPDPHGYRGEAIREYQKELGWKMKTHGQNEIIGSHANRQSHDRDIALRLRMAGYTQQQTAEAINRASPEAVYHRQYGEHVVANIEQHEQVRDIINGMPCWKAEQNINQDERRLDKLGDLSTKKLYEQQQKKDRQRDDPEHER